MSEFCPLQVLGHTRQLLAIEIAKEPRQILEGQPAGPLPEVPAERQRRGHRRTHRPEHLGRRHGRGHRGDSPQPGVRAWVALAHSSAACRRRPSRASCTGARAAGARTASTRGTPRASRRGPSTATTGARPSRRASLCFTTESEDDDGKLLPEPVRRTLCHYFVKTGEELRTQNPQMHSGLDPGISYIDFCGDSPHPLAGKAVPLPAWPYAPGSYGGIEDG